MYNILSVVSLAISCYFFIRTLRIFHKIDFILAFLPLFTGNIIICGYILSKLDQLNNLRYWTALHLLIALISFLIFLIREDINKVFVFPSSSFPETIRSVRNWYAKEISFFEKLLLVPLCSTVLILGVLNAAVVAFTAPHNWDSMTYHLARVAYYIQHNNLNFFNANFWAQTTHPKNSTLLFLGHRVRVWVI